MLLPSLGTAARVWDPLLAELPATASLDVLLFDLPGHGGSPTAAGFDILALAREAADQVDRSRRGKPIVVAGVSMGGALALEIARLRPDMIARFVSFNSALRFGTQAGWETLVAAVRDAGTAAFDPERTMHGWFTADFRSGGGAELVERAMDDLKAVDIEGYIACCRALAGYNGTAGSGEVVVPGVVIGGTADQATPVAGIRPLSDSKDIIRYAELPGAHLAIVENAAAAAALLWDVIIEAKAVEGAEL